MLRNLQEDAAWEVVLRMLKGRLEDLGAHAYGIQGESEFTTLRALHKVQGAAEGLKQFFEDLERGAFE